MTTALSRHAIVSKDGVNLPIEFLPQFSAAIKGPGFTTGSIFQITPKRLRPGFLPDFTVHLYTDLIIE
jgi:hypothetical protein